MQPKYMYKVPAAMAPSRLWDRKNICMIQGDQGRQSKERIKNDRDKVW
jgi:hypothetical protein